MKGPIVAGLLNHGVGDRTYKDLDLLVSRKDFPAATAILERLGFEHHIHDWAVTEEMLNGEITMSRRGLKVDLHWHVHFSRTDRRSYVFDPESMLLRRRAVVISQRPTWTLDPVDTLITLAFHAARSDGHRLVWFKDIERSLAIDRPDLEELVSRCHRARCGPPVGIMLERASSMLDARVPAAAIDALVPRSLLRIERAITRVVPPIQVHERQSITRLFTRSVRSSLIASLRDIPIRTARMAMAKARPRPANETDDPAEKARYLEAVARCDEP
jgi:hypothetical protein